MKPLQRGRARSTALARLCRPRAKDQQCRRPTPSARAASCSTRRRRRRHGGQAGHRRPRDDDVQPAPAEVPVGLRPLPHDEGQPLGAGGHPDAEGRRAVARSPTRSPTSSAGSSAWASATSRPPRASSATTSSTSSASWSPRPELKLVLGRHAHEENIHADSLLYMISSLGINPHECEAMFEDIPTIVREERVRDRRLAARCAATSTSPTRRTSSCSRSNIFVFGQCMEGTQFYGLFGMILSLYRQNKFPGIGQMFRYTLRDESNHIEVFRNLLHGPRRRERPRSGPPEFREELRELMREAVALEKDFIRDCLPVEGVGLSRRGLLDLHRLHRRPPPRGRRPRPAARRRSRTRCRGSPR